MDYYVQEAAGTTQKAIITCGARRGYVPGGEESSLQDTLRLVDSVNADIAGSGMRPVPCIVSEGVLVGRGGDAAYRERVFSFEFSWSPREAPMDSGTFDRTIHEYADRLGRLLGQERVYVECSGSTVVLKRKQQGL